MPWALRPPQRGYTHATFPRHSVLGLRFLHALPSLWHSCASWAKSSGGFSQPLQPREPAPGFHIQHAATPSSTDGSIIVGIICPPPSSPGFRNGSREKGRSCSRYLASERAEPQTGVSSDDPSGPVARTRMYAGADSITNSGWNRILGSGWLYAELRRAGRGYCAGRSVETSSGNTTVGRLKLAVVGG